MMAHRFPVETIDTVMNGCVNNNQYLHIKTQLRTVVPYGAAQVKSKFRNKEVVRFKIGSIRQNILAETFCEINNITMWNTV